LILNCLFLDVGSVQVCIRRFLIPQIGVVLSTLHAHHRRSDCPLPEIETPSLAPGEYVLRVQPIDYAGNAGEWVTITTLVVQP